jgi:phosphoglycolate phosphatase
VKPSLVVVDLDGTLLDTRERHYAVYSMIIQGHGGRPLPLVRLWRARRSGVAWRVILERTLGRAVSDEDSERFLRSFVDAIETPSALSKDRLQPGALKALERIRADNCRVVLVTARRNRAQLTRQLSALGLDKQLDEVVATGGGEKSAAVPRPGVAAWIGDTEEDLVAGRAVGARVYLVSNGMRSRHVLAVLEPDVLASGVGAASRALLSAPPRE